MVAGQRYVSNLGLTVTVSAVAGSRVYFKDEHGCCFYKTCAVFETLYKSVI